MSGSLPILSDLPSGYFVDESPGGILALHVDHARGVHAAGYGPAQDGSLTRSELSGRRPLYELQSDGERLVVRRFSHGGLMRWVTGERYLDPERPFRELVLSDSLRRAGIDTPQVVAARARPAFVGGWYLDLVTRRIEGTTDLGFVMARARAGELDVASKRTLLRATGALVRKLHRHGCLHSDLTPTNLLVETNSLEAGEPRLWVIDLDGSIVRAKPTEGELLKNLRRLYRYVWRREARLGRGLTRTDYLRFLAAYEPDREARRRVARGVLAGHRRSSVLHGLGWFFEALFGRRVDPRESPAG